MSAAIARTLTLMRHGDALDAEDGLDDHERALSARGRRDATAIAAAVVDGAGPPDRLLCSPARRTVETARHVCTALGIGAERLVLDPALYLASADTLLAVIATHERADAPHLMLVGHNPGLETLVARLERRARVMLSTAALRRYALTDGIATVAAGDGAGGGARPAARLLHEASPRHLRG